MTSWEKTQKLVIRLTDQIENRNGINYYQNRHLIGKDTKINKGVYLGEIAREAIVVDFDYKGALYYFYQDLENKNKGILNFKFNREKSLLEQIYFSVDQIFKYRKDEDLDKILLCGEKQDKKISLDVFIQTETGQCRHSALTCAALIERFREKNFLKGDVSVDRNEFRNKSHAWCRYTKKNGDVKILDPMLGYFGDLKGSDKTNKWFYYRPGELQKLYEVKDI